MHGNEKMYHGCITPGCPAEVATKVADGKVMIKKTMPNHSSECVKTHDETYGQPKATDSVKRKRPKPKRDSAKTKDSDSEGSSKSSGDDVPKKQMKKGNVESSQVGSVDKAESKSTDTNVANSGDSSVEDNDRLIFGSSDEGDTSDSSLDSSDSSSDDDSTSSNDN